MASKPYPDCRGGRGVWKMKYRPDPTGRWVTVTLCKDPRLLSVRPPKNPPQEAIDKARDFAEIEYRARYGLGVAPKRAKGLAGFVEAYLAAFRSGHDAGSIRQAERHAGAFLAFLEGRGITTVQGVDKAACRDFLESRAAEGIKPSTLRTIKGYLSPIWSRAVEDGLIPANPWQFAKAPGKVVQPKATFWTSEEVAKIAGACHKPWQSDLVLVLANTGLRISAALALSWKWIDFARGTISVPAEHSKSGRPYAVAMSRVARDVLSRRAAAADDPALVFPNPLRGGTISYDTAQQAIERAIIKGGVPHGTPHDLRHTYGRALVDSGVPINVVQAQLGHATLTQTQRYVEVAEDVAARHVEDFGIGE